MKKIENNFAVTGFVAKDAEVRQFTTTSVARFPLAVARQEKNGEETKRISAFMNIEAWRKNENTGSFDQLTKGTLLTVEGYFKPEEWTDKDGVLHNRIVTVAVKFYPAVEKEEEAPAEPVKKQEKRQEVIPALSGQSGLKAAFVLLVTVPERPHFYTPSYSTRRVRRRPLIFPCKVKAVGNRQGAASFVVNNHQLASSSILVQHK